jgi:hypothetical protein
LFDEGCGFDFVLGGLGLVFRVCIHMITENFLRFLWSCLKKLIIKFKFFFIDS